MIGTEMRDDGQSEAIVVQMIQTIKRVPPRDPGEAARGRAQFLSQAQALKAASKGLLVSRASFSRLEKRVRETLAFRERQSVKVKLAGAFLAVIILILGTSAASAYASKGALPGDGLYAVKTGMESIRLALEVNAANDGVLQLNFAQKRVDEIQALVAAGRYKDVSIAAERLENHLMQVSETLQNIKKKDDVQAQNLEVNLIRFASQNEGVLAGLLAASSDASYTAALQGALQVTKGLGETQQEVEMGKDVEFVGTIESIDGSTLVVNGITIVVNNETEIKGVIQQGTFIKVEGITNGDGSVTAYEISPNGTESLGDEPAEPEKDSDDGEVNAVDENRESSESHESDEDINDQGDDASSAGSEDEGGDSVENEEEDKDEDPSALNGEEEDDDVEEDKSENSASGSGEEEGENGENDNSPGHDSHDDEEKDDDGSSSGEDEDHSEEDDQPDEDEDSDDSEEGEKEEEPDKHDD